MGGKAGFEVGRSEDVRMVEVGGRSGSRRGCTSSGTSPDGSSDDGRCRGWDSDDRHEGMKPNQEEKSWWTRRICWRKSSSRSMDGSVVPMEGRIWKRKS